MLHKTGTHEKITKVIDSAFVFDPNLLTQDIIKALGETKAISMNQLHEFVKSKGVIDYKSDDMSTLVKLLQSAGIAVNP